VCATSATGTSASRAPGPVNTAVNTLDASMDLGLDQWRLRLGYKGRDHLGMYVGAASALDPDSYGKSERTNADLSWTAPQWAPDVGVGVLASYLSWVERTDDTNLMLNAPGTRIGPSNFPSGFIGGPNRWERSLRLSGYITYSGFKGHALRAGAGHDDLDLYKTLTFKNYIQAASGLPVPNASPVAVESSATQPHISPVVRQNNYLYAQDEWNFAPDWTLTAGVRRDVYSDFGGTTNPRLALVWDTSLDLTTKLLWGSAFRAPAFVEAYGINPAQSGNPDIRPERMENVELVANWQARKDTQVNLKPVCLRAVRHDSRSDQHHPRHRRHLAQRGPPARRRWRARSRVGCHSRCALDRQFCVATRYRPGHQHQLRLCPAPARLCARRLALYPWLATGRPGQQRDGPCARQRRHPRRPARQHQHRPDAAHQP
jgi:outer membrane receptor protein involved in Fe transport